MKKFKINYKLQSVSSKTKPVQIRLSLGTRHNGKYLHVSMNTGLSILPEEWDVKARVPKAAAPAGQLWKLREEILSYLERENFSGFDDEQIIRIYEKGMFKTIINEYLARVFKTVKQVEVLVATDEPGEYITKIIKTDQTATQLLYENAEERRQLEFKTEKKARTELYQEVKQKIINANYKLMNQQGQLVNLDWFFDLNSDTQQEILLPPAYQPVQIPQPQNQINHSGNVYELDPEFRSMTFVDLIKLVSKKKKRRGDIEKESRYVVFANAFEEYDDEITLSELNNDVFEDYFAWLRDQYDYKQESYNNYKRWAKAVLHFAERELSVIFHKKQINTKSSIFDTPEEKITMPYLTEPMLDAMVNLEFEKDKKHLEYTRDLFFISAHSGGLSFVDLKQGFKVQTKEVDGKLEKYITVKRQKTGVVADIPIIEERVFDLLKKYNFTFKHITPKHYRECIKEVCELAGFTFDFTQTRTNLKTGVVVSNTKPFFRWVSSHTARRSFCTNYHVHNHLEARLVMAVSQHKTMDAFDKYIQASEKILFEEFVREARKSKQGI